MTPILLGTIASSKFVETSGSFYQIATTTLASATSAINFTSIPSTYTHLMLRFYGQGSASSQDAILLYFNNSFGVTTDYQRYNARGENTSSTGSATTNANAGILCQSSGSNNYFSGATALIPFYKNTNFFKSQYTYGGFEEGASSYYSMFYTQWNNTSAITSVHVISNGGNNLRVGTQVSLYGVE